LAILLTGGSCFWTHNWSSTAGSYFGRGFPLAFYEKRFFSQHGLEEVFDKFSFFLNFLFWTLALIIIFLLYRSSLWFYGKTEKIGFYFIASVILLSGSVWGIHRFLISRNLEACTIPYFRENPCKFIEQKELSDFCLRSVEKMKKDTPGELLPLSLQKKLPEGITFHLVPFALAGGDVLAVPLIEIRNTFLPNVYCRATDKNYSRLFSPLAYEEVLDYLEFRLIKLSASTYGKTALVIRRPIPIKDSKLCLKNPKKEGIDVAYSKVEEKAENYLVDWVYSTSTGRMGVYIQKLEVEKNAQIKSLGEVEEILYCGQGVRF